MVKSLKETAFVVTTGKTALDLYSQRIGERLPVARVIAESPAHWPDPPIKNAYRFLQIVRARRKLLHLSDQFLARFGIFCQALSQRIRVPDLSAISIRIWESDITWVSYWEEW